MNWQNRFLLLILPIFLFPLLIQASQKIPAPFADQILRFTLFNYDNLIADHYEKKDLYMGQLAYLLHKGTGYPIESYHQILNSPDLNNEIQPVKYMLMLNQKTQSLSGFIFVDD